MRKTKKCRLKSLADGDNDKPPSNKNQNLNARKPVQKSNHLLCGPVILILGIVFAWVSNFIFVVEIDNQTNGHNPTAGNDSNILGNLSTQSLQLKEKGISSNMKKNESDRKEAEHGIPRHHHTCKYYLAKSRIPNSGLGIFTTSNIEKGGQVGPGDIVIHANDMNPHFATALGVLLFDYAWDSSETGGQYEGQRVFSFVPGFGSKSALNHFSHFVKSLLITFNLSSTFNLHMCFIFQTNARPLIITKCSQMGISTCLIRLQTRLEQNWTMQH